MHWFTFAPWRASLTYHYVTNPDQKPTLTIWQICHAATNWWIQAHPHTIVTQNTKLIFLLFLYVLSWWAIVLCASSMCWIIHICEAQCRAVQSSAWRSRPSFKWGPEGTESWTAGHIQRELPHIMGSNTRCTENRGCLLCWLTLHPLIPSRKDIDCVWSVPALKHWIVWSWVKEAPHAFWQFVFFVGFFACLLVWVKFE